MHTDQSADPGWRDTCMLKMRAAAAAPELAAAHARSCRQELMLSSLSVGGRCHSLLPMHQLYRDVRRRTSWAGSTGGAWGCCGAARRR